MFSFPAHFLIGFFFLRNVEFYEFYIFWILTPYIGHIISIYFLPLSRLSFDDGFICCAKAFKSNQFTFAYFYFCFLCFSRENIL